MQVFYARTLIIPISKCKNSKLNDPNWKELNLFLFLLFTPLSLHAFIELIWQLFKIMTSVRSTPVEPDENIFLILYIYKTKYCRPKVCAPVRYYDQPAAPAPWKINEARIKWGQEIWSEDTPGTSPGWKDTLPHWGWRIGASWHWTNNALYLPKRPQNKNHVHLYLIQTSWLAETNKNLTMPCIIGNKSIQNIFFVFFNILMLL